MNAMRINMMHYIQKKEGITLLVALLITGVLLGISTSLLNVTLKQYQLAGIAYSSEIAFQAANAGMECALYYDFPKTGTSTFAVPGDGITEQSSIPAPICMNTASVNTVVDNPNGSYNDGNLNGKAVSGEEQNFQFTWGTNPGVCVDVSVYKYYTDSIPAGLPRTVKGVSFGNNCAQNTECTIIQSRGYNVPCGSIGSDGKVVEREYTMTY